MMRFSTSVLPFLLILLTVLSAFSQNWTQQSTGLSMIIKDVEFADQNNGYAVTVAGGFIPQSDFLITENGGIDWVSIESGTVQDFLSISVIDENYAWISGETGTIIHTNNGFQNWFYQNVGGNWDIFGIDFINQNEGWATGDGGIVLHTTNSGDNWNIQPTPIGIIMRSIDFVNENHGWAAGTGCTIIHTENGGAEWEVQDTPSNLLLYDICFVDEFNGWACGNGGLILHTSDGGENWIQQNSGTTFVLYSIDFIDENNGLACGNGGMIIRTANGGETWLNDYSGITSALWGIDYLDETHAWACGNLGQMLYWEGLGHPDVQITLVPEEDPVTIQVNGGTFEFQMIIENNEMYDVNCDIWTEAILPDSTIYGPIIFRNANIPAGTTIVRDLEQTVPGSAPWGYYTYMGFTGLFPGDRWDTDSFQIFKNP